MLIGQLGLVLIAVALICVDSKASRPAAGAQITGTISPQTADVLRKRVCLCQPRESGWLRRWQRSPRVSGRGCPGIQAARGVQKSVDTRLAPISGTTKETPRRKGTTKTGIATKRRKNKPQIDQPSREAMAGKLRMYADLDSPERPPSASKGDSRFPSCPL
jgi:hypothetical protein